MNSFDDWRDPLLEDPIVFEPIPFPHRVQRRCGHQETIFVAPPFDYIDELAKTVRCHTCRGTKAFHPRQYYATPRGVGKIPPSRRKPKVLPPKEGS